MPAIRRLAACAAALVALSGCILHQSVEITLPDIPETYLEQQNAAVDAPQELWWQVFGDPALDALMAELFACNLDLEQAFVRLEQARARVRSVRSAQFPFVSAEGEAARSRQPSFAGDVTGNSERLAAAAGFEIDLWGKLAARTDAARKEAEASLEELKTLYLGLSAELADLYYLAVEQRAQLGLAGRTIASFADTLERVERRYRAGLVPAIDVYQARQSLAAAQAGRHLYEANLAAAEHAVAILLGRYPEREAAGSLATLPALPETFAVGLPSQLVGRRPDLRAALRLVEAADARVAAAIADRFPSINLLGSYGTSRQDFSTGLIAGDFWSLIGSLMLPVADGGRRRAEVERSQAVLREALVRYRQAALGAFREVEDALSGSWAGEERIARLEETERASAAALRLSMERYLSGLTDYLPVLTAQRSQVVAQSDLLSTRRQLISLRIALARALGGAWMDEPLQRRLDTAEVKDLNR